MKKQEGKTGDWFRNWSNEYDRTLGKVKRHHQLLDLVVASSGVKKNHAVLDLGCGTGLLSLKFLKKADCTIQGVDGSPEMLKIFESKIAQLHLGNKITCTLQKAEKLSFPKESFDIVASTVTLHHVINKLPVIRKIHSVLKTGGRFVLGDIDMDTTGDVRDPKRLAGILDYLNDELALAMAEGGVVTFSRMYDNGKKHILNDGEYCISFRQWKALCTAAGFKKIAIKPLQSFERFKVLTAQK
jgi:ubiquinone/menaquinone biosynthesis C-methylase UbiE